MNSQEIFSEVPVSNRTENNELMLDLDGFEGPIDMLLTLAKKQKVDLLNISISALADQYVSYISEMRRLQLEIAADYLVMAAWLAYLKSRLLLPVDEVSDEPSGPEMAEALSFQLQRLESIHGVGKQLMELPRLGYDNFARGAPEGVRIKKKSIYDVSLYDLLKSYGDSYNRKQFVQPLQISSNNIFSVDDAIERLHLLVCKVPEWTELSAYLPRETLEPLIWRSAVASTFAASLELVRSGEIEIQQNSVFEPLYLKPLNKN